MWEIKYYLNGALQGTETVTYPDVLGNGDSPLYIGYSGSGRCYKGEIDECLFRTSKINQMNGTSIDQLKQLTGRVKTSKNIYYRNNRANGDG